MKQIYFIVLLMAALTTVSLNTYCQCTIYYRYDGSGNRTARDIVLNPSKGDSNNTDGKPDAKEETQPAEVFTDQLGENALLIYPNPTQNKITIEIQDLEESSINTIFIYDRMGRLVLTQTEVATTNTLDLSGLKTGIYFMVIKLKGGSTKWNIIKE